MAAGGPDQFKPTQPLLLGSNFQEVIAAELPAIQQQEQQPLSFVHQDLIGLLRKLIGETLASFMVVFTILAVKVNLYSLDSDGSASLLALGVAGGMITMVTIFTLGHVSGSHINPVVTISYTLIRHFPLQLAPMYICAQLTGGIVASLVLELAYEPQWDLVLVTPTGSNLQALIAEGVAGFLLLFVCASVATDTRAIGQFAGLAIGSIITLNIIIAGPISGGGINPARVLGPALVSWNFSYAWIYVVGPLVGGIFGVLMYLLLRPEEVRKLGIHKEINIKEATKNLSSRFRPNGRESTSSSISSPSRSSPSRSPPSV